jgi:hypothetical protein
MWRNETNFSYFSEALIFWFFLSRKKNNNL